MPKPESTPNVHLVDDELPNFARLDDDVYQDDHLIDPELPNYALLDEDD